MTETIKPNSFKTVDTDKLQQEISNSLEPGEVARPIEGHVIIVKTANSPELTRRSLRYISEEIQSTQAKAPVYLGVIDDSGSHVPTHEYETAIKQSTDLPIEYLRIKDQDEHTLLGRIWNRILELELSPAEARRQLHAFQIFLSERYNRPWRPTISVQRKDSSSVSEEFAHTGGGNTSTSNVAAILGAYMMGKHHISLENGIYTHHDDDIVYRTMTSENGRPVVQKHDFLADREILFTDPKTRLTAGKYAGIKGSPLGVLKTACEVVIGILEGEKSYIPQDTPSPYYVFDSEKNEFRQNTVTEAYDKLPEIIESFLARTPLTGFNLSSSTRRWVKPSNIRFDQGNFSLSGSTLRQLPVPVGGVPEFTMIGLIKTIWRDTDINRLIRVEESILHHRIPKNRGGNTFTGNMIGSAYNGYAVDQIQLETLVGNYDQQLTTAVQETFAPTANSRILNDMLPHFKESKIKSLQQLASMRPYLSFKHAELVKSLGDTHPVVTSLGRLLEQINETNINYIEQVFESASNSKEGLEKQRKHILRFIHAAQYWPRIIDIAYQLGAEDI